MNRIINFLLALKFAVRNKDANFRVDQELLDDNWYDFRGGEFEYDQKAGVAGWSIRNSSIRIYTDSREEYLYFEVDRGWLEFNLPGFFMEFTKVAFMCGLLYKGNPELMAIYKNIHPTFSVVAPSEKWGDYFNDETGWFIGDGFQEVNFKIPLKKIEDEFINDAFEDAIDSAFEMLYDDVINLLGKVVKTFELFHKEWFESRWELKPYYNLERRFFKDLISGKRLFGYKKGYPYLVDVVHTPHFLGIRDPYPGVYDNFIDTSTMSWD